MKRFSKILALVLLVALTITLFAGCSSSGEGEANSSEADISEKKEFTIGCMPLNEPAVQEIANLMEPLGYNVEVRVFDGNNLPAIALKAVSLYTSR